MTVITDTRVAAAIRRPYGLGVERTARKVVVIASYTPSLTNFRLELLKRMAEAGHTVIAYAPEDDKVVRKDLAAIGVLSRTSRLSCSCCGSFAGCGRMSSCHTP